MTDSSEKKIGTLSVKRRATDTDATDKRSAKSGARAHQRARLNVEQQKRSQRTSIDNKPRRPDPVQPRASARSTTQPPTNSEAFRIFASCPRGLEAVLADELLALGFADAKPAQAGCRFTGNWSAVWRANLQSRIATRILVELAHAPVANENDIRELAMATNWERWFGPEKTLRVDTSAIRSPMKSLQFCNLLVKDSICDRLRDKEGARPSIDTVRPDAKVHLFLSQDSATLYLDTSGESLFKRGWRFDKVAAPIRENLAAGMLALAGWKPGQALLDPFCGSGTILIEAAWIALDIAPGINRPFAFERLRAHDKAAWQTMRAEATSAIKHDCNTRITGLDLSAQAISAAQQNAARAGLSPEIIQWIQGDARTTPAPCPEGLIITNPPYGERLDLETELMQQWAANLKHHFAGWSAYIISADHNLPSAMRLKAKRRTPLFNGALDCRFFAFDLVPNQYPRRQKSDNPGDYIKS